MSTGKPAYVYTGSEWIPIGLIIGAKYQSASPVATGTGDIWIDSDDQKIYVYNGTSWVESAYLTRTDGLTQSSASSLYLTQSSASTTYAKINSPSFTGTANFTSASVAFNSASISGLGIANSNLLYNGAFQVAQRGSASVALDNTTNVFGYWNADRWFSGTQYFSGQAPFNQSYENDAPTGSGFRKSLKLTCNSANASPSSFFIVGQILEGQDLQGLCKGTASAKSLTLSFWVKSNKTGTYIAELKDNDNSRYVSGSYTVDTSGTWEFKTITFPPDTTGVLDNDNQFSLSLRFYMFAGSSYSGGSSLQTSWGTTTNTRAFGQTNLIAANGNYWQITGVKLEYGTSATPYDFKSYTQELAECQRFYWRFTPGAASRYIASGQAVSTTAARIPIQFPITMREPPTYFHEGGATNPFRLTNSAGTETNATASTQGQSTSSTNVWDGTFTATSAIFTAGYATILTTSSTTSYIGCSAELGETDLNTGLRLQGS